MLAWMRSFVGWFYSLDDFSKTLLENTMQYTIFYEDGQVAM